MLNKDSITNQEAAKEQGIPLSEYLDNNYNELCKKYGSVGIRINGTGMELAYLDLVGVALSPMVITYGIVSLISLLLSIILGKILFPQLSKVYENSNKELVDITSLRTAEQVNNIAGKKEKNKKPKKEWF